MKNQNTVLYVNPVPRISVQGRDKQNYMIIDPRTGDVRSSGQMNKSKEFTTTEEFSFPYNPDTGRLETGLDVSIRSPFKDADPQRLMTQYALPSDWAKLLPEIVVKDKISKQVYYEIIGGVEPDFYTSRVPYTIFNMPHNVADIKTTYLQEFKMILYGRPNRFEDDGGKKTARQRLSMLLCKVHPKIANSKAEANSAYHSWYISEENEAEREVNAKRNLLNKAAYHMYKLQNEFDNYRNFQVAILLKDEADVPIITNRVSPAKVEAALNGYIDDKHHQAENCESFLEVMELLDTPDGLMKFEVRFLVQQAINTNVIAVRDGYYVWHSKAGEPNVFKHSHYEKLLELLITEMQAYNPEEDVTNWYGELLKEVKSKGAWIEDV